MEAPTSSPERPYLIEEMFESYDEYHAYLVRALALFRDKVKRRSPTFSKYVPDSIRVEFLKDIKAPQIQFPRYSGIIVIQLPDQKFSPKKKAALRERALQKYVSVVKRNEIATADEIAMRMKILDGGTRGGLVSRAARARGSR